MKNKTIKIAALTILALTMIATVYYDTSLRAIFYKGRTQYSAVEAPVLITTDPKGKPWVVENNGREISLKTLEKDQWIIRRSYRGQPNSIVFDQSGNLWMAGNMWFANGEHGLYKDDGKKQTSFKTDNSGLASNNVYRLAVDNLNRVWMIYNYGGARSLPGSGVSVFDGTSWTTFTTQNSGLPTNKVTAVAFDSEGRAWFGTTHGLSVFDGDKWTTYSPRNSGLVGENISAIAFDKKGHAWIATHGDENWKDGINVFDGRKWIYYSWEQIGLSEPISEYGDTEIVFEPPERIWIHEDNDVRVFDGSRWVGLSQEDGFYPSIYSTAVDQQGNIWIANGNSRGVTSLASNYALASAWRTQPQRVFLSSGGTWYIAFILMCLLIAVLRDYVVPVALALFSGIAITLIWVMLLGDLHLFGAGLLPIVNPGVYATVGAMIGAFIGIVTANRAGRPYQSKPVVIGLVAGLALGIFLLLPLTQLS